MGLDQACDRLGRVLPRLTEGPRAALSFEASRLAAAGRALAGPPAQSLSHLRQRLLLSGEALAAPFEAQTALAASRLHDLSPLSAVARGFAVASTGDGSIVRSVDQVSVGQQLEVTLADGVLECAVSGKEKKELSWNR